VKLIIAIIKPFKLDEVREALTTLGVAGMTVTEVKGFRTAEGPDRNLSRGPNTAPTPVPKIKIEVVCASEIADHVVESFRPPPTPARSATARSSCSMSARPVRIRTAKPTKLLSGRGISMKHVTKLATGAAGLGLTLFVALPAWAQDAAALQSPAAPRGRDREQGRYRLDAHLDRAGHDDPAGPGAVLWRSDPRRTCCPP
jgi:nitrogen regulatory protein P-II 2